MNTFSVSSSGVSMLLGVLTLLFMTTQIVAAPLDSEDEQVDNALVGRPVISDDVPWDAINTAALRKMLMQMVAEERLGLTRESRSWPHVPAGRGWGARSMDGQTRQWRADKRQARFRQCYFNPISCFRK